MERRWSDARREGAGAARNGAVLWPALQVAGVLAPSRQQNGHTSPFAVSAHLCFRMAQTMRTMSPNS